MQSIHDNKRKNSRTEKEHVKLIVCVYVLLIFSLCFFKFWFVWAIFVVVCLLVCFIKREKIRKGMQLGSWGNG